MCDPHTRKPRGFGFITYHSEKSVGRVCATKFHHLNGKRVEVKRAIPQERMSAEEGHGTDCAEVGSRRAGQECAYPPNTYMGVSGQNVMLGAGMGAGMGPIQGMPFASLGMGSMMGPMMRPMMGSMMGPMMGPMMGAMDPAMSKPQTPMGGMYAGMAGVPNALSPGSWGGDLMTPAMGPRPSANMPGAAAAPPARPLETNAALNAALSTANSVLSNAAAAEPQPEGDDDTGTIALSASLQNAFMNPGNNYGSASVALSAGLRAVAEPGVARAQHEANEQAPLVPVTSATGQAAPRKQHQGKLAPKQAPPRKQEKQEREQRGRDKQTRALEKQGRQQSPQHSVSQQEQLPSLSQEPQPAQLQQQLQQLQQRQQLLQQLQHQQMQLQMQQQQQQARVQMQLMQHQQIAQDAIEAVTDKDERSSTDLLEHLQAIGVEGQATEGHLPADTPK
jgi:hypothetical protein